MEGRENTTDKDQTARVLRRGMGVEQRSAARQSGPDRRAGGRTLRSLPRAAAAALARGLQSIPLYRAVGGRLRPAVTICEAGHDDLAAVQRLFDYQDLTHSINQTPSAVTNYVAKRGRAIIGFSQYVRHPETHFPWVGQWLFSLNVRWLYRGMGLGEILMQRVINQAVAEGAPELLLTVDQDNARAIRLYRKHGFERITLPALEPVLEAEEKDHNRRRRIIMRKRLRG